MAELQEEWAESVCDVSRRDDESEDTADQRSLKDCSDPTRRQTNPADDSKGVFIRPQKQCYLKITIEQPESTCTCNLSIAFDCYYFLSSFNQL